MTDPIKVVEGVITKKNHKNMNFLMLRTPLLSLSFCVKIPLLSSYTSYSTSFFGTFLFKVI